jgi:hypothetical protein
VAAITCAIEEIRRDGRIESEHTGADFRAGVVSGVRFSHLNASLEHDARAMHRTIHFRVCAACPGICKNIVFRPNSVRRRRTTNGVGVKSDATNLCQSFSCPAVCGIAYSGRSARLSNPG